MGFFGGWGGGILTIHLLVWPCNKPFSAQKKKKKILISEAELFGHMIILFLVVHFCFGHAHGIWKFTGQRSHLGHSSDNTESVTAKPPENSYF